MATFYRIVQAEWTASAMMGEGARLFALEQGLQSVPADNAAAYEKWRKKRSEKAAKADAGKDAKNHDTIALLILGANGDIAGGCSTSGWGTFSGEQVTMILSKGPASSQP